MIRRLARKALRSALAGAVRKTPPAATRPTSPSTPASPPTAPSTPAPAAPEAEAEPPEVEVDHLGLAAWLAEGRTPLLLDIREAYEVRNGVLQGATWIPMNDVPRNLDRIPRDRTVVVYCAAGVRSFGVAHWLRQQGVSDAWSLVGGAGAGVSAGVPWQQEGPLSDRPGPRPPRG